MTEEYTDSKYLTATAELAELIHRDDVIIIDTREPEDYMVEHIPGAINIYEIFTYLTTKDNGGYESMRSAFTKLFGNAGICLNEKVVLYEDAMDNGYGRSCRGYFLLRYLGHKDVTVLHGGFQAWLDEKRPISKEVPRPEKKLFTAHPDNSIILTREEMLDSIYDTDIIKLDCRDRAEWVGISSSPYGPEFTPRKGRIPGAIWIEWYNAMKNEGSIPWFKDAGELKILFENAGINADSKVNIYCFKGARTSNMYIAMKLAGIKNVRNYFGSWNEWSRDFSLPIEEGYPKHK